MFSVCFVVNERKNYVGLIIIYVGQCLHDEKLLHGRLWHFSKFISSFLPLPGRGLVLPLTSDEIRRTAGPGKTKSHRHFRFSYRPRAPI